MHGSDDPVALIARDISEFGLILRGGLAEGDSMPTLSDGRSVATVLLIGHAGSSHWPHFTAWRSLHPGPDPLDRWTRSIIEPVAHRFGATALYPFDRPWWPFQSWITEIEGLKPSPLGILIHPDFGLWHGYRAALAFEHRLDITAPVTLRHACDDCTDRPCIAACPAQALDDGVFEIRSCRDHLGAGAGQAGCMQSGCFARNACPVGRNHRYTEDQLRFHMEALDLG